MKQNFKSLVELLGNFNQWNNSAAEPMQEHTSNERAIFLESGWHRPVASITYKNPIETLGASCRRPIISFSSSILLSLVSEIRSNCKSERRWTFEDEN